MTMLWMKPRENYHGIVTDTKMRLKIQNHFRSNLTSKKNASARQNLSFTTSKRRTEVKESREKSLLHTNGVSGSLPWTLTLLSIFSARPPGSNGAATQVHWTFHLGEQLHSPMLNPWRWAPIQCSPLLGQSSRHQRSWCPLRPLCHHPCWHHHCGGRETLLLPSQVNGPVHLGKPRQDCDHGTKCAT